MNYENLKRFGMMAFLWVAVAGLAFGTGPASKVKKPSLKYTIVQEGGTNASAVAWDTKASNYVTVIAGNADFPFEVFGSNGKAISQGQAGLDWRGLWYNPEANAFEGNCAGEMGWASIGSLRNGSPTEATFIYEGQYQPDFQSVGAYDYVMGQVVFYDPLSGVLALYNRSNADETSEIALDWAGIEVGDINATTVGFTGIDGYEFVLLDYNHGKLLYFNREGKRTGATKLPGTAPLNDAFAFSFANGRAFLYDKSERVWYGYKVF